MLFKLITSSCKSDMSKSLKIILIEVNIIKINIIKIYTKMKFSVKDFFSKCDQIHPQFPDEILNVKLHFMCSVSKLTPKNLTISESRYSY